MNPGSQTQRTNLQKETEPERGLVYHGCGFMNSERMNGEIRELAALDAAGALPSSETQALEEFLSDTRDPLYAEVIAFREVAARIALAVIPRSPRPELKVRLMTGIRKPTEEGVQVWRDWKSSKPSPIHVMASNDGQWEPLDIEGIRVKRLYVDP